MCLPPVSRVPRVVVQQPTAAKQEVQPQPQQQQQNICDLELVAPLPELFLKSEFLPEVLLSEGSPCSSSSGSSNGVVPNSSGAASPLSANSNSSDVVDLSWFDQDLLATFDPLPLVEEQQPTAAAYQLFEPVVADAAFPGSHDSTNALTAQSMEEDFDEDEDEDEEDFEHDEDDEDFGLHLQSPGTNSASGSDNKARKNNNSSSTKTKNRKRKLACDLSADELAKTREINRIAAQRHRQAAKAKRVDRQRRFDEMGKRNELLREQVRDMTAELKTLRRLVIDMYSPSGARHVPMQQTAALPLGMDFAFLGMA